MKVLEDIMWIASHSYFQVLSTFIKIKFYSCHSCVMLAVKHMQVFNDEVNFHEIIAVISLVFKYMS